MLPLHKISRTVAGPPWNLVCRRVTYDLETEEIIQDVFIADITNKQRTGLPPKGHKNGTRTVFYYRRPEGSQETHTCDEKLTLEEPTEGEAPERHVTAKAKSTPARQKRWQHRGTSSELQNAGVLTVDLMGPFSVSYPRKFKYALVGAFGERLSDTGAPAPLFLVSISPKSKEGKNVAEAIRTSILFMESVAPQKLNYWGAVNADEALKAMLLVISEMAGVAHIVTQEDGEMAVKKGLKPLRADPDMMQFAKPVVVPE
eukprot:4510098-Amphidinium_carterae.1